MLAQQELVMYTEKMTKQTQQISDYEYEISLLRKQLEALETEHEKDKKKIAELEELLAKAREVFPPTGRPQKIVTIFYAFTLPNIQFQRQNQEKICNNTIYKDITAPQVCRYTPL